MSETFVTPATEPETAAGESLAPETTSQQEPTLQQAPLEPTSYAPLVDRTTERLAAGRTWAQGKRLRAQEHIRAHPLRTTAYAVGAGIVTGMLLKGVRRRES